MKKINKNKHVVGLASLPVTQYLHIFPTLKAGTGAGTGTSLTQSDISLCLSDSSHFSLDATLDINSEVSSISKNHSTSIR